jgi:hypothetical protein
MPRRESDGYSGVPTPWRKAEGNTGCVDIARRAWTPRGQRPHACTETSRTGTGRSHGRLWRVGSQTASGTPRGNADDERPREVGQLRSTREAAEQSRGTGRGGGGGKGAGRGETARAKRVPDSGPGRRAKCARAGTTGSSEGKAAAVHGAPGAADNGCPSCWCKPSPGNRPVGRVACSTVEEVTNRRKARMYNALGRRVAVPNGQEGKQSGGPQH